MSSAILLLRRETEPFHSKNIYNSPQILKSVFKGIVIRIRFPVQTPLGAHPGSGTQPYYKALGDLQVEIVD